MIQTRVRARRRGALPIFGQNAVIGKAARSPVTKCAFAGAVRGGHRVVDFLPGDFDAVLIEGTHQRARSRTSRSTSGNSLSSKS